MVSHVEKEKEKEAGSSLYRGKEKVKGKGYYNHRAQL